MTEATYRQDGSKLDYTPAVAVTGGQVIQLADGRAAVAPRDIAAGVKGSVQVSGVYRIAKTTGIVILDGGKVFWDHSTNAAHYKKVNDRDFLVGCAYGDAASADDEMDVVFNVEPRYLLDLARDPYVTVAVGTAAAGGFGDVRRRGGTLNFLLTSTNEAQKLDALSKDGFASGANAIVELAFAVPSDGSGSAVDVSMGIANATHATDADSITDSLFVHLEANNVNINLESDDGTTEVAATDSTLDYSEGGTNRVEVWFDLRDPSDVQVYINGALVLGSTVFNIAASTATWKLLVHVEKTASTDTYELDIDWLRARIAEQ